MANRTLAGRYDLKEKIGEGGMSVVFRAQDVVLNRFVAVKILRPEYTKDEHFISSFRKESQIAASIVDPNIVNVYDVGREGNIYFIVMELVDGMPLSDIIKREGPLDPRRAVSITRQIANALSTAHKHHLIHRDVKPHNVLLAKDNVAKIADFGIAKQVNNNTLVGEQKEAVMGSIHYFSPEQARGTGVDERSDIYSLGIVLFEMVTGQVPFDGESAVEVAVKHISEEITPPSRINPSIPQDVEDIILKCTAKDPDNRYNSADELITDLSFVRFSKASDYGQELEESNEYSSEKEEKLTINKIFDEQEEDERRASAKKFKFSKRKEKTNSSSEKADSNKKKLFTIAVIIVALVLAFVVSGVIYNKFFTREQRIKDISLPNFVGMTLDEAHESYSAYNLTFITELEVYSDDYPAGQIISQTPDANASVKIGSEVSVTVSKGQKEGAIPNLVGKSQTKTRPNAQKLIESYGYTLGKITYKSSTQIPEGCVISQSPEKGTIAVAGTVINLVVSSGAPATTPVTTGSGVENTSGGAVVVGDSVTITIPNGSSGKTIGNILAEAGLCDSAQDFVDKANDLKLGTKLRAGDYTIPSDSSLEDIVKIIAHQK